MIYLNNAATSYPKPPSVIKAMTAALECPPTSPLRSNAPTAPSPQSAVPSSQSAVPSSRSAVSSSRSAVCPPTPPTPRGEGQGWGLLSALRRQLGCLLGIADTDRIFFCSSATDAINRVLGGLRWKSHAFSIDSHNSVLRPMANNLRHDPESQYSLTACNHCSNVTGEIAHVRRACQEAHSRGSLFLLDAAQSAGCIPVDVDRWGVDILVFTGHKALFGPTGTGGYYVRRGIPLRPTQFGGTGRDSSIIEYDEGDWEYEVGTPNTVGLAGLKAGVDYVLERGVENIFWKQQQQTAWLIRALQSVRNVRLYVAPQAQARSDLQPCCSDLQSEQQGPVVSFNIEGLQPADVGYILQNSYAITVRTGLHCAPLIHQQLRTSTYGTVRVSLSDFTTQEDLDALVKAVREIANSL